MSKIKKTILGKRLMIARQRAGLTQLAVESITGISQTALSRLENGHRINPRIHAIGKLATVYNCTIDSLLN